MPGTAIQRLVRQSPQKMRLVADLIRGKDVNEAYAILKFNKKLAAKFGADKVEKVRWYAAMRALQLRPLRLPKPQVKRGQYPS